MKHFLMILTLSLFACEDEKEFSHKAEAAEIAYGTSFGECIGYCRTEAFIIGNDMTVEVSSWGSELTPKSYSTKVSDEQLERITLQIDFAAFEELPEVIGCPDCADGGAEWLELAYNGTRKRVTFEYMADIEPISAAIKELRKLTAEVLEEEPD